MATKKSAAKRTATRAAVNDDSWDFDEYPEPTDDQGRISVIVELDAIPGASQSMAATTAERLDSPGFEVDREFEPVPIDSDVAGAAGSFGSGGGGSHILRGTVADEDEMEVLLTQPGVAGVWRDTPIAPFAVGDADFAQAEGGLRCRRRRRHGGVSDPTL